MSASAERGGAWLAGLRALGRGLASAPRALWALVALGWLALIWRLSSLEPPPGQPVFWRSWVSNGAHALEYGLLALWLALALPRVEQPLRWARLAARDLALVMSAVALWGASDEFHQSFVPGRDATPYDCVTDVVGAACVLWIACYARSERAHSGGLALRLLACLAACWSAALLSTLAAG